MGEADPWSPCPRPTWLTETLEDLAETLEDLAEMTETRGPGRWPTHITANAQTKVSEANLSLRIR